MKTTFSFLALVFLSASQAHAYGHSFSIGQGVNCSMRVEAQPLVKLACVSHTAKEVKQAGGSGVDVNGDHYQTVTRFTDETQCLDTTVDYKFATVLGDLAQVETAVLPEATFDFSNLDPDAMYKQTGGIDLEIRNHVRTYIYIEPLKSVEDADKEMVGRLKDLNLGAIRVSYNDAAKTFSFSVETLKGVLESTVAADFAKDVRVQAASMTIPLETKGLKASRRNYSAVLACQPVSVRR